MEFYYYYLSIFVIVIAIARNTATAIILSIYQFIKSSLPIAVSADNGKTLLCMS